MTHLSSANKWKSIRTIIKIDSERYIKSTKNTQTATHYYISSLHCEPKKIAEAIFSHWKIENNLHWHLDVSFGEDKSRKRYKSAAQNFSSILKLSLKILLLKLSVLIRKVLEENEK